MKAVILAGGRGKRMKELTKFLPKPLIKIQNRPFLKYVIQNLIKAGITEIGIVVHYKKEKIEEFLKENKIKAELIEQSSPLGTGHAIKAAENFVNNENFIVVMGDNYYSEEDIKNMIIDDDFEYVAGLKHKNPEKYGVLVEQNNFLTDMPEKPKIFVSDLINIALYKFTPRIFKALEDIPKSERGEYEINDAIKKLAKEKRVKVIKVKNNWLDLGCPEDIPKLERFFKNAG